MISLSKSLINNNRRVLVIDDNAAIHEDFRKIFDGGQHSDSLDETETELFGVEAKKRHTAVFEMDSALQGKDGLEKVVQAVQQGKPYAMAFIDVRMPPGWDGIETTAKIWEAYPDLQVVICTAYSDYSWDEMIAKVGQSDRLVILKKPFDNVEVIQLANALTEKWCLLQQVRAKMQDLEQTVFERTTQLEKSEEHFRLIAENVGDLITIVDGQAQRLYCSPSYERALGLTADELRTTLAYDQVHPQDLAKVKEAAQNALQTGQPQVMEYRAHHKSGAWLVLESHTNPIRNGHGQIEHLVIVARDVTERKKAEKERQQMEVQLRHAQKMESIGQLAAGIAHEINTPTQYIGDNTRFLKDAFADLNRVLRKEGELLKAVKANTVTEAMVAELEKAAESADVEYLAGEIPTAIQQSLDGVERVAKIVRAMKEFSHPGVDAKTPIDLNHAIETTLTVCQTEWKYVADVVTEFTENLPAVPCLPGEINQTFLNIIVNAAHAIGDVVGDGQKGKGSIVISTRKDGEWVEVRIRDTGAGIPEHVRGRIFDPFFTTKEVGKGTGQGLAIAHAVVVEKHKGQLFFETELAKGTTFIIRLPLVNV